MPVNTALKNLARDGRFSLDDARTMRQLVQSGQVSNDEAKETLQRYGDVMDADAGRLVESETGGARAAAFTGFAPGFAARTLRPGTVGDDVKQLQRALMALGLKQQDPTLTLPSGVDGHYGSETTAAVRAFQRQARVPETGIADPATLRALDAALRGEQPAPRPSQPSTSMAGGTTPSGRPSLGLQRPATGTQQVAPAATARATPQAVVDAAEALVNGPTAKNYGVAERWINNDPRHAAAVGKPINGTGDKWKCNLFAGNVMAAAGFEPPYYGNHRTGGEYPNANQLYKWSDKYAARFGNANHVRFHMADEVRDLPNMPGTSEEKQARMQQLFDKLQPGDLVIADHVGTEVADGGHCRVFLGKNEDGTYRFAQAGSSSAEIRNEAPSSLMSEEHVWILRPNAPRR